MALERWLTIGIDQVHIFMLKIWAACIQIEELKFIEIADIYMPNETHRILQKEHIGELKWCKMWDEFFRTRLATDIHELGKKKNIGIVTNVHIYGNINSYVCM